MINYHMKYVLCGWLWSGLRTGSMGYYRFNVSKKFGHNIIIVFYTLSFLRSWPWSPYFLL